MAVLTDASLIEHRWMPFANPIPRTSIESTFDPEDRKRMGELGIKARRAFEILKQSFARTIANQALGPL